jgi:splicing factor 3B subunit 2
VIAAESEEEEEEEEEVETTVPDVAGLQTPSGLETPSGLASVTSTVPGGLETPDFLELRKQRDVTADTEVDDGRPKQLYQVVPEREANIRGFLGSERVYDVSAVGGVHRGPVLGEESRGNKVRLLLAVHLEKNSSLSDLFHCQCGQRKVGDVEVALDASELEGLSQEQLQQRYEASKREVASSASAGTARATGEDLSDVYAAEASKRRKKGAPLISCLWSVARDADECMTVMYTHRGGAQREVQILM